MVLDKEHQYEQALHVYRQALQLFEQSLPNFPTEEQRNDAVSRMQAYIDRVQKLEEYLGFTSQQVVQEEVQVLQEVVTGEGVKSDITTPTLTPTHGDNTVGSSINTSQSNTPVLFGRSDSSPAHIHVQNNNHRQQQLQHHHHQQQQQQH